MSEPDENMLHLLLMRSIEELELSVRSYTCLKDLGVHTIGDLIQRSSLDLLRHKNFGRISLNEIVRILARHGLALSTTSRY